MSEVDNTEELEVETQEPTTSAHEDNLNNFVDAIQAGSYNQAGDLFKDMLDTKVASAMEAEKIAVADTVFNGGTPTEDEVQSFDDEEEVEDFGEVEVEDEVEDLELEVEETEEETEVEES
jgi:hypothetical protein